MTDDSRARRRPWGGVKPLRVWRYGGVEDWPWVWEVRIGDEHPVVGVAPTQEAAMLAGWDGLTRG